MRVATRGSPLARWQADHVAMLLGQDAVLVVVETTGDRRQDVPIWEMGGRGVFVKEVQAAVLDGRADVAVHSAKDLPSATVEGLALACVPERADARDVLVGSALVDLPVGATIATGSSRRRTQLQGLRPDLRFVELRGNIQRRVATAGTTVEGGGMVTAVIAAGAALLRQDMEHLIADWLPIHLMTPQVGQGALAVECREDDADTRTLLHAIEHPPSRRQVDAERSFLVALGGDCDLPAGAHATLEDGPTLDETVIALRMVVASMDGSRVERAVVRGTDPHAIGAEGIAVLPVSELL